MNLKLLSRNEFTESVFNRDNHLCVICNEQGKGWVHGAILNGTYDRDQLSKDLKDQLIDGNPILGIESFTLQRQVNKPIGILTKEKMW